MRCWICVEERLCIPYKSNPRGILSGASVMICIKCKKSMKGWKQ